MASRRAAGSGDLDRSPQPPGTIVRVGKTSLLSPMRARERRPATGRGGSPELRFVALALAWPRTDARASELRQNAQREMDWTRVTRLSRRHRVGGLFSNALDHAKINPPEPARDLLARHGREVAFHELSVASELSRLIGLLGGQSVKPIVLKGLSVAVQSYGRVGLRQNRDIDLLIPPGQLVQSISLLLEDGYIQVEPAEVLSPRELLEWMKSHKDLAYRHSRRPFIVELHWRLFDNAELDRSLGVGDPIELALPSGVTFNALRDSAAFAYMSAHGAQHAWSRLKWLADFSAHCQHLGPERVTQLYHQLRLTGLAAGASQGLMLAQDYLQVEAPALVQADALRSVRVRALRGLADQALLGSETVELEDQPFGSTLKTFSHYLLKGDARYWLRQAAFDLWEVPKSYSSPFLRRIGPAAKIYMWLYVRLRRQRRRSGRSPDR